MAYREESYYDPETARELLLIPASTIRPEVTRWVWQDRIPLGGACLFIGMEGVGKTTILVEVLSRATRGQLDGDLHGQPVSAVYATAEDSWSRTLRPRFEAAGANLDFVHFVEIDGLAGGLSIPADLDLLTAEMERVGAVLLVLDPLGPHLHESYDTHRDAEVRRALAPLAACMDEIGAAAIGVMHFNKGISTVVLDRVNGSRAFTAAARSVLAVGDDPDAEVGSHVLVVAKSNLGRLDVPALRYRIEGRRIYRPEDGEVIETSGVAWQGEAEGVTARDIFAAPVDSEERSDRDAVADVIRETLTDAGGRLPRPDVVKAVRAAGLDTSDKTIQRVCRALGVERKKSGFGPGSPYMLTLPDTPHAGQPGQPHGVTRGCPSCPE